MICPGCADVKTRYARLFFKRRLALRSGLSGRKRHGRNLNSKEAAQ